MSMVDATPQPYAVGAGVYWDAGWRGVIPLPAHRKGPPPEGWTGRAGAWPSRADIFAWATGAQASSNLGLRLPDGVVGVDVDAYGDKLGAQTLADAEQRWGVLPPTWRDTARDDGTSGIRFYRVPVGLYWPGEVGPGIEIVQQHHRYAVAWPSIHPETGTTYRWINPDGLVALGRVPSVDELPTLPDEWIIGLTQGRVDDGLTKADLSDAEATAWLVKHGGGVPCEAIRDTVDRYLSSRFDGTASRHDAARDATARLFAMAADGHSGAVAAVNEIGLAFRGAFDGSGRDFDRTEWQRLYLGAVRLAAVATPDELPADPCTSGPLPEIDVQGPASAALSASLSAEPGAAGVPATGDPAVIDVGAISPADAADATARRAVDAELRVQRARRAAMQLLDAEEAAKSFREPPSRWTLRDELELPDPELRWAVADVLPAGGNALLTAAFKAGKTTLVSHLARCLVDGQRFLGRFDVPEQCTSESRVALWNYEVGADQYRRWLRDAGIEHVDAVTVLNLRGFSLPLLVPSVADWAVRWLASRNVRVWVVDPFARAFGGNSENDNSEVGRFLEQLDVIKERAGVAELILPTHTGRMLHEHGQERARGATRLDDWPDVRWSLNRDELGNRYFGAMGRDADVDEFQLGFNTGTRQLFATGQGDRQEVARTSWDNRVLGILQVHPSGMSTSSVARALFSIDADARVSGAHSKKARELLAELSSRGLAASEQGARNSMLWRSTGPRVIPDDDDE